MYEVNSVTWNRMNDLWWQKIIISKAGVITCTYHYKLKSCEPAIVFEIDTKISRQICGYTLIEKDIRDSLLMLDEHHKIYEHAHSKSKDILLKGLVRAIAVTYGKCFVSADGRGTLLDKSVISSAYKKSHDDLMEMRHQYAAHAGESVHESCKSILVLPPVKKYKKGKGIHIQEFTELRQTITAQDFFKNIKFLLDYVHSHVKAKLHSLKGILGLQEIHPDHLYKFAKNKGNRISLTEVEVENLKQKPAK